MASFVNYDLPTEFLVYAHAAPAIKWVLDDIEEMSLRMTDGKELKFAYDNEVSWPYSWYFRDYPSAVFVGENPTVQNLDDAIFVVVGDGNRGKVEPILEDRSPENFSVAILTLVSVALIRATSLASSSIFKSLIFLANSVSKSLNSDKPGESSE